MGSKSRRLTFSKKPKQHENSAPTKKAEIRREICKLMQKKNPAILDVFCADGEMWRLAYNSTENYIGLDLNQYDDPRSTFVCDNVRYLRNDTNLSRFDLFDIDAFGSPAQSFATICERLGPIEEEKAFVLTDGCGFASKMNSLPGGMLRYLGLEKMAGTAFQKDNRAQLLQALVLKCAARCSATIANSRIVETKPKGGNTMIYAAFIFKPSVAEALS